MDDETTAEATAEAAEPALDTQVALARAGGTFRLVAAAAGGEPYVPLRPLCAHLGIAPEMQVRRIKDHAVLARYLRAFRLRTARGVKPTWCLALRAVGFWLGSVNANQVRPEVRDGLVGFQEELVAAAEAVFLGERPRGPSAPGLAAQLARHDALIAEVNRFALRLAERTGALEDRIFGGAEGEEP